MLGAFARFLLATGGALLAPLFVSAHGTEFLLGKLTISPGEMRLELTADCDGNPMIADRKEAADILPVALQMRTSDSAKPLTAYAPLTLEDRSQFDETAPLPAGTFDNSVSHQLLTALWQWKPDRESVRFTVPKGSKHDVLLWVIDSEKPKADPRWMMLLGGDVTPEIVLPQGSWWMSRWGAATSVALLAILLPVSRFFLRRRRD